MKKIKEIEILPKKLYKLRKINNFTQAEVAFKINISYQSYQAFEYGKTLPTLENFIKIAKLYGVSLDYLVTKSDN